MCNIDYTFRGKTQVNYSLMTTLQDRNTTRAIFSGISETGSVRSINQDSYFVGELDDFYLAAVADGMGGHKTGEVASQKAIEILRRELLKRKNHPPTALAKAVQAANLEIFEYAHENPEHEGMGTTLTSLLIDDHVGLIGHVGDSRAYLIRDNSIRQLTYDHSWVAERVRQGVLSEQEAKKHRLRNIITNALGSSPEVKLDILHFYVEKGDKLLLCSDGISIVVNDEMLLEIIAKHPVDEAAQILISEANAKGSPDNITAIIIEIEHVEKQNKPYSLPSEHAIEPQSVTISPTMTGIKHIEDIYPRQDAVSKMKRQAWYPYRLWLLGSLYLVLLIVIFAAIKK